MAEYFDTEAAALDAIKRWHAQDGTVPVFYARGRLAGTEKWMVDFRVLDYAGDHFQLEGDLTPTLQAIVSPANQIPETDSGNQTAARNPREFVRRPDLACSHCGNAEIRYGTHLRCCRCNHVRLCEECQKRFKRNSVYGCPTCGYHEDWDDVYFELAKSPAGVPPEVVHEADQRITLDGVRSTAAPGAGDALRERWWRVWER